MLDHKARIQEDVVVVVEEDEDEKGDVLILFIILARAFWTQIPSDARCHRLLLGSRTKKDSRD
jgi:hypothetical protein